MRGWIANRLFALRLALGLLVCAFMVAFGSPRHQGAVLDAIRDYFPRR